jgi:hypothetical protein
MSTLAAAAMRAATESYAVTMTILRRDVFSA